MARFDDQVSRRTRSTTSAGADERSSAPAFLFAGIDRQTVCAICDAERNAYRASGSGQIEAQAWARIEVVSGGVGSSLRLGAAAAAEIDSRRPFCGRLIVGRETIAAMSAPKRATATGG
jgi:hypothetical protein